MSSIFTRIISGEIPGEIVHEDEVCVAFLDAFPLRHGHTLVVPRAEVDQWLDLEPGLAQHLMAVAQRLGRAQQRAFGAERVGLVIAGFEVAHTHLHLIPADAMKDLDFSHKLPEGERTPGRLAEDAERLRAALAQG